MEEAARCRARAEVLLHLQDAETERRGFIITGDSGYLAPYGVARQRIDTDTAVLRRITGDNPRHQRHLDALRPLVRRTLTEMDSTMHLRATAGFAAADLKAMNGDRAAAKLVAAAYAELLRGRTRAATSAA